MQILKDFKDFVLRGNVIELAVAFIMGTAFAQVVRSLVTNIIMPLIGKAFGQPDFSKIHPGKIPIGNFLNDTVTFLLTAVGVYFFVVYPYHRLNERWHRGDVQEDTPPPENIMLLREIRDELRNRHA